MLPRFIESKGEFKKLKTITERQAGGKFIAAEEIDTIDSFFDNLMGRSTETGDPTIGLNKWLRDLRRFNFVRVLNQVGIAQLPEYGVAVSQQGLRTLSVEVKGPGSGRETALRSLQSKGFKILTIRDTTPMPHNGARPPKRRRV